MGSPNIKDLLTSFSPSSDFFAISSGDGRIKIWDTLKGQLQTEFSDISDSDELGLLSDKKRGHLSLDYTCMKWVQLESKKKRRAGGSILVLGTGSGDVLALDVSVGQLKWRVADCHPGGVTALSHTTQPQNVYTAGVDGMVCQIDSSTGNVLGRFKASPKAISSLSISSDGKVLATAAGQLKTFKCSNHKKIQKFSGHPVSVRCMIFSETGEYILSSGVGERHVAMWHTTGKTDETRSASCLLSMDEPAVSLDTKTGTTGTEKGLEILAVSEAGVCYLWQGSSISDLKDKKPTRIQVNRGNSNSRGNLGIFAGKIQSGMEHVIVAYGSVVKPCFERVLVSHGSDVCLELTQTGVLLPLGGGTSSSDKGRDLKKQVIALDRANAEDAVLPLPKLYTHEKKRKHGTDTSGDTDTVLNTGLDGAIARTTLPVKRGIPQVMVDKDAICIEDRMRELGLLGSKADINTEILRGNLSIDANLPMKKIRAQVMSMSSADICKLFENLISAWKSRLASPYIILQWIYCLLVHHGRQILSHKSSSKLLDNLQKITSVRSAAAQDVLKLSGRLELIMAQIDKSTKEDEIMRESKEEVEEEEDDDDDDEEIDEMVYGEEDYDESESD